VEGEGGECLSNGIDKKSRNLLELGSPETGLRKKPEESRHTLLFSLKRTPGCERLSETRREKNRSTGS